MASGRLTDTRHAHHLRTTTAARPGPPPEPPDASAPRANRFVYSFIGVSNFLPVTEKGGKVCLALGGEPVLFDTPPQGYVSGKKNVMGVRPMDVVFDAESPIRATIRRDTFLGNQYDYQVELMGRELRVERNALDVLADPTRYEAGQEVGLKFLNVKFYEEEAKA